MAPPHLKAMEAPAPRPAGTRPVAPADPSRGPVLDALYRLHQSAYVAWARRRHRASFDRVECFCMFVGYPRSGHSLVGALLNAHRDAVISHELDAPEWILAGCSRDELYARILARAWWFDFRGNTSNYRYQVPGQWQGRFAELRVIGDKRGGALTRRIAAHPGFLPRVRALVGVPLRLIHVVRNPFDNISAISTWQHLTLEESVEFYFGYCRTTSSLGELCEPGEVLTLRHEALIRDPERELSRLCASLGLEADPAYLDACRSVVFPAPTRPRSETAWPAALVRDVERRAREYAHLEGYRFELEGTACPAPANPA